MPELTKDKYFEIFNIAESEVLTIGFNIENHMVVITKQDMTRILYQDMTQKECSFLEIICPLEFGGFQHTTEGITFVAYVNITKG